MKGSFTLYFRACTKPKSKASKFLFFGGFFHANSLPSTAQAMSKSIWLHLRREFRQFFAAFAAAASVFDDLAKSPFSLRILHFLKSHFSETQEIPSKGFIAIVNLSEKRVQNSNLNFCDSNCGTWFSCRRTSKEKVLSLFFF